MFCPSLQTRIEQVKSLPELLTLIQKDQEKLLISKQKINDDTLNQLRNDYLAIYKEISRQRSTALIAKEFMENALRPKEVPKKIQKWKKSKKNKNVFDCFQSINTIPKVSNQIHFDLFDSMLLPALPQEQPLRELGDNLEVSYDLTT
jgi:hypothetical protein